MLQKNERFQQDCQRYRAAIENMPDGHFKIEATKTLNELINEVKKMDNLLGEMAYTGQIPTIGSEIRDNITSIRKKLDIKIKDWGESKK